MLKREEDLTFKSKYLTKVFFLIILTATLFTACGQGQEPSGSQVVSLETWEPVLETDGTSEGESSHAEESLTREDNVSGDRQGSAAGQTEASTDQSTSSGTAAPEQEEIKALFVDSCIPDQTFEVSLSEYSEKVWFVPYAPSADTPEFRIKIIQNGKTLAEENVYIPEGLRGTEFAGLDAVSFFDVNLDGSTDIVLIATYGETAFASVFYGYEGSAGSDPYFASQWILSDNLTSRVKPLTISGIRSLLTDGSEEWEFTDYREVYRTISSLYELEHMTNEITYDLIDLDGDEIPELAAGLNGYYLSLYTYRDGRVYKLMDDEGYGIHGNPGYEYIPGSNRMRSYSTEYAGAILYTYYMTVNEQNELDTVTVKTYNFDDVNGNGIFDEDEMESMGKYSISYIGEREISREEAAALNQGEYEIIQGRMSRAELLEKCAENERFL